MAAAKGNRRSGAMKQRDTEENRPRETQGRGGEPGFARGPSERRGRTQEGQDSGRESGDLGNEPREDEESDNDVEREQIGNR